MTERERNERTIPDAADGPTNEPAERAEAMRVDQAERREPSPNEISEETVEEIAEDAEARARPAR